MKISGPGLVVALVLLLSWSPSTRALDLGLGGIVGGLTNLTGPIVGPIVGNLTNPIVGGVTNVTGGVAGGLNLTNIVGPINNLTNGVVNNPALGNITSGLNLTNIIGSLNNITGPLINALTNFTGPALNISVSTNVTLSVMLNLPSVLGTGSNGSSIVTSFPNSITIAPLGLTEVAFTVYTAQGSNVTSIPVMFTVPILTYLNFPVSGSVEVTVDFPLGSTLSVVGITNSITRLFFGVSWQTFPQLSSVVISKLLPGSAHSDPLYILDIPALMCT